MKSYLRQLGMCVVRIMGTTILDVADGKELGKAIMVPWRGRVHLIGYEGVPLRVVCVPQNRVCYWRIELGFSRAEVPDYARALVTVDDV